MIVEGFVKFMFQLKLFVKKIYDCRKYIVEKTENLLFS